MKRRPVNRVIEPSVLVLVMLLVLHSVSGASWAQTTGRSPRSLDFERQAEESFARDELSRAGVLYKQAADAALTSENKTRLLVNSSWVYYLAGDKSSSLQAMLGVMDVDSAYEIETQLYNDDFVAIWREARRMASEKVDHQVSEAVSGAVEAISEHRLDDARRLLGQALDLRPTEATAVYNLALIEIMEGRRAQAILMLQRVNTLATSEEEGGFVPPNLHARALNQLGRLYLGKDWSPDAVGYLETATELDPTNGSAWNNLGLAYQRQFRFEDSMTALLTARSLEPDNVTYINNLALAYFGGDGWQEALELLTRASEDHPSDSHVWCNLGRARHGMGRLESAVSAFERCLSLTEDQTSQDARDLERDARVWLSKVLYESKRYNESLQASSAGLRVFPANIQLHLFSGLAHAALDQNEQALTVLEQARRLGPGRADVANNLGSAYFNVARYSEAKAEFERALSIRPDFSQASENLALARERARTETTSSRKRKKDPLPRARMMTPSVTGGTEDEEVAGHAEPGAGGPATLGISVAQANHPATGIDALRIDSVEEDSLGAQAGLMVGDFILRVDGEAVPQPNELIRRLNNATRSRPVVLDLFRGEDAVRVNYDGTEASG